MAPAAPPTVARTCRSSRWVRARTIRAFLQHLGLETLDFGYGGEGRSTGVYHSRYDTYEHHSRFVDPGFVYDALLAKTVGRAVIAAADSDLPIQQAGDFADAIGAICRAK